MRLSIRNLEITSNLWFKNKVFELKHLVVLIKVHLDLSLSYVGIPEVIDEEETTISGKITFDKLPYYIFLPYKLFLNLTQ